MQEVGKEYIYHFRYNNEDVSWKFTVLDNFLDKGLNCRVTCDHKEFIKAFESPTLSASSLDYVVKKGKESNVEFFELMRDSYRS